jgi:hypothetical protein
MSDVLTPEDIERLPKWLRPKSGVADDEQKAKLRPIELERAETHGKALLEHMSPPGALGLPELLDARRIEYGLPDELFGAHAAFGYVLVHQLPQLEGETYGDTSIIMTDRAKDKDQKEAPRGIIVRAGLRALDELRSNGIDLGHIVMFSRNIPYRARMTIINGRDQNLIVLQAGDIFASEDLARNVILGKAEVFVSTDERTQYDYHYFRDTNGDMWKPHNVKKKV